MHYLQAGEYTHLSGEINSLYHEMAVKMGVSDSVMNILYVICEEGDRVPPERNKQIDPGSAGRR